MAQGDPRFSHISVSAGDDDDVVIVAGAAPEAPLAPKPEPGVEPEVEPASEAQAEAEPKRAPESANPKRGGAEKPSGKREAFEETTLEDLQGEQMSSMQKAIIVLAVIGVAAFAVYYLFMR